MNRLTKLGFWLSIAALLICLTPIAAFAGVGHLRAYADVGGLLCDLSDPGGVINVYIFHEFSPGDGATGSRFSMSKPTTWTYLNFVSPNVIIGIPITDIAVGYGACLTTKTPIGYAVFLSVQPSAPCSQVALNPPEGFPSIFAADCSFVEVQMIGSLGLMVNPDQGCCCDCISTEQSTWGSVKALYR